ncbi:hypothetical protein GQ44DRAFT_625348 [Phaeosphaeriaceae sp. PMI808]|nr:hypothetical protein GQ44DRAFT_625348 [Phaeosphaeriaceae sp. PMI808]
MIYHKLNNKAPWHKLARKPLIIGKHQERRSLSRSARRKIGREHAVRLWIISEPDAMFSHICDRTYPPATLLGLPRELRQRILYKSFDFDSFDALKCVTETFDRHEQISDKSTKKVQLHDVELERMHIRPCEEDLIRMLNCRAIDFSCVSPVLRVDMKYVKKQWQVDLENYIVQEVKKRLHASRLLADGDPYRWVQNSPIVLYSRVGREQGKTIKVKCRLTKKSLRPLKCWYCTTRHPGSDPVCPMERQDPVKWEMLTKKICSSRRKVTIEPTFRGSRRVL